MNCFRTMRKMLKSFKAHRDVQLSWCGNFTETHSFYRISGESPDVFHTRKLGVFTAFHVRSFAIFFTLTLRKIPLFHLTSSCGSIVERHNFRIVSGDLLEIMPKLCLSTKFPHQEIRWNDDISRSVTWRNCSFQMSMLRKYF